MKYDCIDPGRLFSWGGVLKLFQCADNHVSPTTNQEKISFWIFRRGLKPHLSRLHLTKNLGLYANNHHLSTNWLLTFGNSWVEDGEWGSCGL